MRASFDILTDHLRARLAPGEAFTAWFQGEDSDFVRMNQGKVRQPGSVSQRTLSVDLIRGQRHAAGTIAISGDAAADRERVDALVVNLARRPRRMFPTTLSFSIINRRKRRSRCVDNALPDAARGDGGRARSRARARLRRHLRRWARLPRIRELVRTEKLVRARELSPRL